MPSDLVWGSGTEIASGHGIQKALDVVLIILGTECFQNGWTQALTEILRGGRHQRALMQQVIECPPIEVR
jgi:hypothetical protein